MDSNSPPLNEDVTALMAHLSGVISSAYARCPGTPKEATQAVYDVVSKWKDELGKMLKDFENKDGDN